MAYGPGLATRVWALFPREPAPIMRSLIRTALCSSGHREYLAIEAAHLVQWDVLGAPV
jgi:hypothetical protein